MRITWANDIHLDSASEQAFLDWCEAVRASQGDVLVICGDIETGPTVAARLARIRREARVPVYFVLGNHDFYHSSVGEVRFQVQGACARTQGLVHLNRAGVVSLSERVALIGHDGWTDARSGDLLNSGVKINDDNLIADFAKLPPFLLRGARSRLADESADYLTARLREAFKSHEEVLVATHVPPSASTAWHKGERSNSDWLPHMVNTVLGERLAQTLFESQDRGEQKKVTVLCGHTHGACDVELAPGLRVLAGEAVYGAPRIQETMTFDAPTLQATRGR